MSKHTDETALKSAIWTTFQYGMSLAEEMDLINILDIGDSPVLDKTIININFGYKNNDKIDNMKAINDLCSEIELMILNKVKDEKLFKKMTKLNELMVK